MRIISTTISNGNEDIIGDALWSVVDWVDICLLIDNGITDRTIDLALEICGHKLVVMKNETKRLEDGFSMADWRNLMLEEAFKLGGDWAVMLDTDERMIPNGVDVRAELARFEGVETVLAMEDTGKYAKERFFRLPAQGFRDGFHAHEEYTATDGTGLMSRFRFSELPKPKDALDRRLAGDLIHLRKQRQVDPLNVRWAYYIGATLENLHRPAEAVVAYRECSCMAGNSEQRAWACYRAAVCLIELGRKEEAIQECARGIGIHPGTAELAFLAGTMALELSRFDDAIAWAQLAISNGHGSRSAALRCGFRGPQGLFEGPYQILEQAYAALGAPEALLENIGFDVARRAHEREAWQAGEAA